MKIHLIEKIFNFVFAAIIGLFIFFNIYIAIPYIKLLLPADILNVIMQSFVILKAYIPMINIIVIVVCVMVICKITYNIITPAESLFTEVEQLNQEDDELVYQQEIM